MQKLKELFIHQINQQDISQQQKKKLISQFSEIQKEQILKFQEPTIKLQQSKEKTQSINKDIIKIEQIMKKLSLNNIKQSPLFQQILKKSFQNFQNKIKEQENKSDSSFNYDSNKGSNDSSFQDIDDDYRKDNPRQYNDDSKI